MTLKKPGAPKRWRKERKKQVKRVRYPEQRINREACPTLPRPDPSDNRDRYTHYWRN